LGGGRGVLYGRTWGPSVIDDIEIRNVMPSDEETPQKGDSEAGRGGKKNVRGTPPRRASARTAGGEKLRPGVIDWRKEADK